MKIIKNAAKGVIGMALAIGLTLILSSEAMALGGVNADGTCTIYNEYWDHNNKDNITLRTALYVASDPGYRPCKYGVDLKMGLSPNSPVVIRPELSSSAHRFIFDGAGVAINGEGMVYDDTDGLGGTVDVNGNKIRCAMALTGSFITVKNVTIKAPMQGNNTAALCLIGTNNVVSNVTTLGGNYGVVVVSTADANKILPNNDFSSATDFGIYDLSMKSGVTTVIMTNAKPQDGGTKGPFATDQDGIVIPSSDRYAIEQMLDDTFDFGVTAPQGGEDKYIRVGGAKGVLSTKLPIVPIITEIKQFGKTSKYEVKGFFTTDAVTDSADGGFAPIDCKVAKRATGVELMGILMTMGSNRAYVGTVGNNSSKGINLQNGTFDFYINPSDAKHPELSGGSFVLVPVDRDWRLVGRASNFKSLSGGTDCAVPGSGNGNGSNGGGSGSTGSDLIKYTDEASCNADTRWQPGSIDTSADSDMDGIPDFLEVGIRLNPNTKKYEYMPNVSNPCKCDNTLLTCWYSADTDGDGIRDGDDGYPNFTNVDFNTWLDASAAVELPSQPLDSNKDALADTQTADSDGDGLLDGREDRLRLFNRNATAYYMRKDSNATEFYTDSNDKKVVCQLPEEKKDLGIEYGIYKVGAEVDKPQRFTMYKTITIEDGQQMALLACVNETAASMLDFNGKYDGGRGETDARNADTEGDCVCDGDGAGCKNVDNQQSKLDVGKTCSQAHNGASVMDDAKWRKDRCPDVQAATNNCAMSCIEHEVLGYVKQYHPEYIKDLNSTEIELKDSNNNNVADLFELTVTKEETVNGKKFTWKEPDWQTVQTICSDIDQDGIPDCVERWKDTCNPNSFQKGFLNPYTSDSDGDDAVDGMAKQGEKEDVCPYDKAKVANSDVFTTNNPNYACDPKQVYQGDVPRMLACYLDRDADGLRDCEEDRSLDGQVKPKAIPGKSMDLVLQSIFDAESDPLNIDTDADGITDFNEVRAMWGVHTNPNNADTDADTLMDKDEDRDGDTKITLVQDQSGQGCSIAQMKMDTDPRNPDSDGDGLTDGMEVKGSIVDKNNFYTLIQDKTVWSQGGIEHGSNPNAKDGDGDGMLDNQEFNGTVIQYYDSNPCLMDSDGDSVNDDDEFVGCALNKDGNCSGTGETQKDAAANGNLDKDSSGGIDSDSDGLADNLEVLLGTDPKKVDSDGDGVKDGDEDSNHNGIYEPTLGESNPMVRDTDGDGLEDGYELRYGTDPSKIDTDGDCIPDGIEDTNRNGDFDTGTETNALSSDTDGDQLPDGYIASSGMGEDLNCNGIRERNADGVFTETDPRNPDSDMDGEGDYNEMTHGGFFNIANADRASVGHEGCSLAGTTSASPTSMFYLMGLLMAAAKVAARKLRKNPA